MYHSLCKQLSASTRLCAPQTSQKTRFSWSRVCWLKTGTQGWEPQPLQYCKDKEAEATLFNHIDMHSILLLPFQPSRAAPADCLKHSLAECLHILEASRKDWSKCPVMRKESGLALPLSLLRGIIMNWALELFDGAFAPGCCMWAFCAVISSALG